MGYTLWRNGELLGEIVLLFGATRERTIGGMFAPTDAFNDIAPVMQVRDPFFGDGRVHESTIPDGRANRRANYKVLKPMAQDRVSGLRPELILELRDSHGAVVPRDMFVLQPMVVEPDDVEECRKLGIAPTGWMLLTGARSDERAGSPR